MFNNELITLLTANPFSQEALNNYVSEDAAKYNKLDFSQLHRAKSQNNSPEAIIEKLAIACQAIESPESVTSLSLYHADYGQDRHISELSHLFKHLPGITSLNFGNNNIETESAHFKLADLLQAHFPHIEELWIADNYKYTGKALLALVDKNPLLTSLSIFSPLNPETGLTNDDLKEVNSLLAARRNHVKECKYAIATLGSENLSPLPQLPQHILKQIAGDKDLQGSWRARVTAEQLGFSYPQKKQLPNH
jgi:hypothetical protein